MNSGIYDLARFLEVKCSRKSLLDLAKRKRLSVHGTKRDLASRIVRKRLESVPVKEHLSTLQDLLNKPIEQIEVWIKAVPDQRNREDILRR